MRALEQVGGGSGGVAAGADERLAVLRDVKAALNEQVARLNQDAKQVQCRACVGT